MDPSTHCYNAVALQYRYTVTADARGGNVNSTPIRIRTPQEILTGFRCGFYTSLGSSKQAGGPVSIVNAKMQCERARDIRPDDIVIFDVLPGLTFRVAQTRSVPHGPREGQIQSFQICTLVSVENVSIADEVLA